ncbi:MAG: hypothetical protein ACLFQ6_12620, partial [Candidatus Sumerlaeia bacterium]
RQLLRLGYALRKSQDRYQYEGSRLIMPREENTSSLRIFRLALRLNLHIKSVTLFLNDFDRSVERGGLRNLEAHYAEFAGPGCG